MGKRVFILGSSDKFENYQKAVEAVGGTAVFGSAEDGEGAYDAFLLPGGGDMEAWRYGAENIACKDMEPERDAAELALLARFVERRTPVLGICRGLQTINVFFGGTLLQDIPNHSQIDGVDRQHLVTTASSPLRELFGESMTVNSAHHQAIDRVGVGLEAVQWAADGTVEAVIHQELPVWAVQWHPERFGPVGLQLIEAFLERVR